MYLRNSKWSQITDDLHIFMKTSEMSVQTIRIIKHFLIPPYVLTSSSSDSYDVELNSGPL